MTAKSPCSRTIATIPPFRRSFPSSMPCRSTSRSIWWRSRGSAATTTPPRTGRACARKPPPPTTSAPPPISSACRSSAISSRRGSRCSAIRSRNTRRDACELRNFLSLHASHVEFRQPLSRRRDRAVHVDAAAGVLDHDRFKVLAARVLRRIAHAKIEREAGEEHALEPALAQITGKAGGRRAVVLIKGRIGIDRAAKALADHQRRVGNFHIFPELRARRALHAVIRP